MTAPFIPNCRDKKLCAKVVKRFHERGLELPVRTDGDVDALSGTILELFKTTGDETYFEAFHALYSERLTRFISRSPWASAWSFNHAELAAEILYDIFRFAHTFTYKGSASFRAWIRVLTCNKIKKTLRSRSTTRLVYTNRLKEMVEWGLADPLNQLILTEHARKMIAGWWILLKLCAHGFCNTTTTLERKVLHRHITEGMSYRALASTMNITEKEAILAARRGRRKVSAYIKGILTAASPTSGGMQKSRDCG